MKSKKTSLRWSAWPAQAALAFTLFTSVYPNSALSQIDTEIITDPVSARPQPSVYETVLRNGVVVQQRGGPDVAGGEWMFREEKINTFQAISTLIRMIDADHETLIGLITDLGGVPDIEKLKASLRNIKFAPMDEVISRNSSGYREHKQLEYDRGTNSIIALKPFFTGYAKLIETNKDWNDYPLKLIELLSIEASHSQELGMTAETTLTQSYAFAKHLFSESLRLNEKSKVWCGQHGDLKTRATDCAWMRNSFVMWPPRRPVTIALAKSDYYFYTGTLVFDPSNQLVRSDINLRSGLREAPVREVTLQKCEYLRIRFNYGARTRLGTVEEMLKYQPDAKSKKIYFLTEDVSGVVDPETKATATNLEYRSCGLFGCEGGDFTVKAMCVFE